VGFCRFCRFFFVNICASENSCTRSSQNSPLWPAFTCEIPLGAYICRYSLFFVRTAYFCCNLESKIYYLCLSAPICTYLLVSTVLCSRSLPYSAPRLAPRHRKTKVKYLRTTFSAGKKCRIMTRDLPKQFCGAITAFIADLKFVTIECMVISFSNVSKSVKERIRPTYSKAFEVRLCECQGHSCTLFYRIIAQVNVTVRLY
jgi:hypothetical protein